MFCKKIYSLKTYEIIIPTSYTHTYTHKKNMRAPILKITRARKNNCGRPEISARALRRQKTQAKAGMYFQFSAIENIDCAY